MKKNILIVFTACLLFASGYAMAKFRTEQKVVAVTTDELEPYFKEGWRIKETIKAGGGAGMFILER